MLTGQLHFFSRLEKALDSAVKENADMYKKTLEISGKKEAEIFEVHGMMIQCRWG